MALVRVIGLLLMLASTQTLAFGVACQLVAQIVGSDEYQAQPLRMASMQSPSDMPEQWQLSHIETHGAWHIYQAGEPWMAKEQCAPLRKVDAGMVVDFVPVVLNKTTGHNAVITGSFVIKVYRRNHIERVVNRYGFKVLSPLPNPESLIVDVRPQKSYDLLIQELDRDKDVRFALPILSEPRVRP